jgi:hypothetical protein
MQCKEMILPEKLSLYDSNLLRISIYSIKDEGVYVETIIELGYPTKIYLKLIFKQASEYFFYWDEEYSFYAIESYKLFKLKDNSIYCSFDPSDRNISVSENDGAIIKSKYIEGYCSSCLEFITSQKIEFN